MSDVTDALLQRFGRPGREALETTWLRGEIGSRECMALAPSLHITPAEIDLGLALLDQLLTKAKRG